MSLVGAALAQSWGAATCSELGGVGERGFGPSGSSLLPKLLIKQT